MNSRLRSARRPTRAARAPDKSPASPESATPAFFRSSRSGRPQIPRTVIRGQRPSSRSPSPRLRSRGSRPSASVLAPLNRTTANLRFLRGTFAPLPERTSGRALIMLLRAGLATSLPVVKAGERFRRLVGRAWLSLGSNPLSGRASQIAVPKLSAGSLDARGAGPLRWLRPFEGGIEDHGVRIRRRRREIFGLLGGLPPLFRRCNCHPPWPTIQY